MSDTLNKLAELHNIPRNENFRNPNGVFMNIMHFVHHDPNWEGQGLSGGSAARQALWDNFADKPQQVAEIANAILAHIAHADAHDALLLEGLDNQKDSADFATAFEGRVLTASHVRRERDPRFVADLKDAYYDAHGFLDCGVCTFDFERIYGPHGHRYMEAHHIKPLSTLDPTGETLAHDDFALLCANCHRMIHRKSPWLTPSQLQAMIRI